MTTGPPSNQALSLSCPAFSCWSSMLCYLCILAKTFDTIQVFKSCLNNWRVTIHQYLKNPEGRFHHGKFLGIYHSPKKSLGIWSTSTARKQQKVTNLRTVDKKTRPSGMFVERCMQRSRKVSRRLLGHRIEAVEASWSLCKYFLTKSLLEPCWASFISPLEKKTKRDKKLYLKSFGANRLREEILRKLPWFSLLLQAGWPPLMAHLPRESYRLRGLKRSHASKACDNNTQSHWNFSKPSLVSKIQIQLQKCLQNQGASVGC